MLTDSDTALMDSIGDSRDRIELPPEIVDQVLELVLDKSFAQTSDKKDRLLSIDHGRRSVGVSIVEAIDHA